MNVARFIPQRLPHALTVFLRLFAFFVLPFVLVSLFFLAEQYRRIRGELYERSLMQMRLVALGLENGIKDSARLESGNPLLVSRGAGGSLQALAIPLVLKPIARTWFESAGNRAFLYLYGTAEGGRLVYLGRRKNGFEFFVFRAQFLEDHFLTSTSLEPSDALFLFNSDGTPAMSNLIEAEFAVPRVWQQYLESNEVAFDTVRSATVGGRDFLVMGAQLPGLPVTGLLVKPADVAFRSLKRSLYTNGALLFAVFVASLLLSRYFARYEVRLVRAREEALRAARARAEFLSTMSHEIRTPLNAVLGASELLAETALDANQETYVAMFRRAGRLLLELINDILDFARVESGTVSVESVAFDPRALVAEVREMLEHYRKDDSVSLVGFVHEDVPARLIGDARHLRQVLSNLVSNGLKFTKQGIVEIRIERSSAESRDIDRQGGGAPSGFRFSVRDSGPGIPKDKQYLVFESFGRIGEDDRVAKGTGLGLAISARLVRAMGGEIALESEVGAGSTFSFVLPLAAAGAAPIAPAARVSTPAGRADPVAGGVEGSRASAAPRPLSILLAEDNEDNRLLFSAFLAARPNTHLELVVNGQEAVEKARAGQFDVILMDMSMPVLDGFEATKQIRAEERAGQAAPVPIIALTAYTMSEEVERCFLAGCSDYLAKPLGKAQLLERLEQLFRAA